MIRALHSGFPGFCVVYVEGTSRIHDNFFYDLSIGIADPQEENPEVLVGGVRATNSSQDSPVIEGCLPLWRYTPNTQNTLRELGLSNRQLTSFCEQGIPGRNFLAATQCRRAKSDIFSFLTQP